MNKLQILLKITGSIMALAGSWGCGMWLAARRRRRIELLREMEQILIFLYGEIEYAAVDVAELFQILAGKMCYFGSFFEELCRQFQVRSVRCPALRFRTYIGNFATVVPESPVFKLLVGFIEYAYPFFCIGQNRSVIVFSVYR